MTSTYTHHHHHCLEAALVKTAPHHRRHSARSRGRRGIHDTIGVFLALILALFCAPQLEAQNFAPTDIVVPEGDSFRADAMNDNAEIVGGYSTQGQPEQPVVWRNGVFTPLPLLPGTVAGWARGINNVGQMVGGCRMDGTFAPQACVWENGTVRALPAVTGTTESAAWAINDVGTIVGHVYTYPTAYGSFREAVVWQGNTVGKLAPPTAGARTFARAIDNFGRVAVSWTTQEEYSWEWHAARWTPTVSNGTTGTMTTLGEWGSAYDINDSGVVCGNQGSYGYLWTGTTGAELYNPFWGHVKVYGVNNANVAVGSSEDSDAYITTALVWDDQATYGRDLNYHLTASTPVAYPGSLYAAFAINGSGQILAYGANSEVVLLTPSSDPVGPHLPPPPAWVNAYPYDGEVYLEWPTVYYAESFNVKRATVSGGPYTTIATGVGYGYSDTSVVNGTQYYYVVSSVSGDYESADSPESAAMPVGNLPEAPTSVSAEAGDAFVHLQWSDAFYAESYNVKRSTVNGGPYTTIATGVPNGYRHLRR